MSTSILGGAIQSYVHKRWFIPVLEGICFVLFGALILLAVLLNADQPAASLGIVYTFLACFLIADGLVSFIGALLDKGSPDRGWSLAAGLLSVALGVLAFIFPKTGVATFAWLLIVFLLVAGILACLRAVDWRKVPGSGWGWSLTFGILCIAIALYCLIFPIIGAVAISFALVFWIALLAIVAGAFLIWAGVRVKRLVEQLAKGGLV